MIDDFSAAKMYTHPESDQQVEVEPSCPLVVPLEQVDWQDCTIFVSDENLTISLLIDVSHFDEFIYDWAAFHVDVDWYLK